MTLGSLFDGIGGFPLAASHHGITPVWASEIAPAPISITRRHFPNMKHLGDITQINGADIEPVDIITFGSPCQDLSIAGKRVGLKHETKGDGETTRSGLLIEAIRIINEMREVTNERYPTWAVWENVPGALSSNDGLDFRAVLESFANTDVPMPNTKRWARVGLVRGGRCDIGWRILDAQFWGVPQRRRRVFLVADFRSQRTVEVLFKPESLRRDSRPGKAAREEASGVVRESVATSNGNGIDDIENIVVRMREGCDGGGKGPLLSKEKSLTLATNNDQLLFTTCFNCNRITTGVNEYTEEDTSCVQSTMPLKIMAAGFDLQHITSPCNQANVIPGAPQPTLCKDDKPHVIIAAPSVAHALKAKANLDHREDSDTLIIQSVHQNQNGEVRLGAVSNTLNTNGNASGRNAPLVAIHPDYCIQGNTIDLHDVAYDCRNHVVNDNVSGSLQAKEGGGYSLKYINSVFTFSVQRSDDYKMSDKASSLTARDYKSPTDLVANKYFVRRLTTTECERLQGFPDGWTAFRFDGKPISDSKRYAGIGNSVAIPCVDFIMAGIVSLTSYMEVRDK